MRFSVLYCVLFLFLFIAGSVGFCSVFCLYLRLCCLRCVRVAGMTCFLCSMGEGVGVGVGVGFACDLAGLSG